MDLARQKENLEEIFRFFDFAKKYGYNTVALYLEDRIKTPIYPYASDLESYSAEEIGKITAFAEKLGLELIPVVSNFAHAERFLEHEELAHIAELRRDPGFMDRAIKITACPLLPEAQSFFDTYFAEVAALFPKSRYFHAGLDEDFDIGSCELCKADVRANGGIGHLFLNHIKRTNEVINALGKEMIMWDDMFVYCPEIIAEVPKNVIMCSWCYDYVSPYPRSPFANQKQVDLFEIYDKNGIRYMPAVWCNFAHNVDTYTEYAKRYSPIGYYNTTWGMSEELNLFVYPLIAYTGLLWSGKYTEEPIERLRAVAREVVGATDPADVAIIEKAIEKPTLSNRVNTYYYHGALVRRNANFEDEYKDTAFLYDLLSCLKVDNDFVKAIKYRAMRSKLTYEALIVAEDLLNMQGGLSKVNTQKKKQELLRIKEEFTAAFAITEELWARYRDGIPCDFINESKTVVYTYLDKLIERADGAKFGENGILNVHVLLPDKSICSRFNTTVRYTDGTSQVFEGSAIKPYATACYNIADKGPYFFIFSRLIDGGKIPESVEFSVYGFGNVCIQHAYITSGGKKYTPVSVEAYGKRVENPDHIIENDSSWTSLGEYSMIDAMTVEGRWQEVSGVKINLA